MTFINNNYIAIHLTENIIPFVFKNNKTSEIAKNLVGSSFFPSPFSGWVWHGGQFLSAKREGERKEGKEGKEGKGKGKEEKI